jgi:molybdate transport system permease protein
MSQLSSTLLFSLFVAASATALVILIGVPLAYLSARITFFGKSLLEAAVTVPLVLPPTVVGYFLIVLLGRHGWMGSLVAKLTGGYTILFRPEGAVLAAAVVSFPLLYLPAKAAFAAIERELEEVATLMGATRIQAFWHVSLPLARRGIASGLLLTFARALGEFGATVMVLGQFPNRQTLPISIYDDWAAGEIGHATTAVLALTLISLALILLYNRSPWTKKE